jgi:hypothetical protein
VSFLNVALPLLSSVLAFFFAAMVLDQWWQRRRSFQLVWAVGLLWYAISAGTEFAGSAFGWSEPLYRTWYLVGALYVPPYLALGTIYLLSKTRFGYFAGVTVMIGGALSLLFSGLYPGSTTSAAVVFAIATVGGVAIIVATAVRRPAAAHVAAAVLVIGSVLGAYVVLTAVLPAPGFATDPRTHVPVGSAFPGYVRVITPPDNIAGALTLVFGALYSAYVYMPKKRVLPAKLMAAAIVVNFVASLPSAAALLVRGKLSSRVPATILIALGAFIPGLTSGLDRFGVTWSFLLGEFLGLVLIFAGFLVSEEVFRNVRLGATLWSRAQSSLERELG